MDDFYDLNQCECGGDFDKCMIVNSVALSRLSYIFKYADEVDNEDLSKEVETMFFDISNLYHKVKNMKQSKERGR